MSLTWFGRVAEGFLRIGTLIAKELIQLRRDRVLLTFILLVPALQLILMARAIERGVSEQPLAVLDLDHSQASRELITRLDNAEEVELRYYVQREEELRRLLDQGQARLAVVIPADFSSRLKSVSPPPRIRVLVDGTNILAGSVMISTVSGVVSRISSDLAAGYGLITPEWIDFRTDVRFNPAMDFRDFSIPAQLGFILYQVTLAVASLGLARERELGTLEALIVTPLNRLELALGKGIPAVAVGGLNFWGMWAVGRAIFQVPMNGSLLLLAVFTLPFILVVVGWGLTISALSRTQQQAILLVFILAMMEITFSGFLVPVRNMPTLLQFVSRFSPLQHYLVITRSLMLKGAGWMELWPQVLTLVGLAVLTWSLAWHNIARRLE